MNCRADFLRIPEMPQVQKKESGNEILYRAQRAANLRINPPLFPHYSAEHIQLQEGLKRKALWCYSKAYNGVAALYQAFQKISSAVQRGAACILSAVDTVFFGVIYGVINAVHPINPINGKRQFILLPRKAEKVLGDFIIYPLATYGKRETDELIPGTHERIADKVNSIVQRLVKNNEELLNPKVEETKFNYRAKTILSPAVNAGTVAGGGMIVFSQIVKEIDAAIKAKAIKESTIELADGSKVVLDLSEVSTDDVLAALMGHEITHAASRHSLASILHRLIIEILAWILPNFELIKKIDAVITIPFHSRSKEYEADVTGAYLADQAGFNPLGAIYLQEILGQRTDAIKDLIGKYVEFIQSHPHWENRKKSLFAAIQELRPELIEDCKK